MSPFEFDTELDRLRIVSPKCWTDADSDTRKRWIEELRRQFGPLDPDLWRAAIESVIDSHKDARRLPLPSELREAYDAANVKRSRSVENRVIDTRPWLDKGPQGCISGPKCLAGRNCIEHRPPSRPSRGRCLLLNLHADDSRGFE